MEEDDAKRRQRRLRAIAEKRDEWRPFLGVEAEPDDDGWYWGWCPLHDNGRLKDAMSAQFNFHKGVMRCLADPTCHVGKRGLSLSNLLLAMARVGVGAQ